LPLSAQRWAGNLGSAAVIGPPWRYGPWEWRAAATRQRPQRWPKSGTPGSTRRSGPPASPP